MIRFFLFILILNISWLCADVTEDLMRGVFTEGVNVDLREPKYSEGVLTTEKGGVIEGLGVRIQAKNIIYTRKQVDGELVFTIDASGDLMVEFEDYLFIGERLEYDFKTRTGTLYCGRTTIPPWYIGGRLISLCADGSYVLHDAFVTTSEGRDSIDWQLIADTVSVSEERYIAAKDVTLKAGRYTTFWIPSLKTDLQSIDEHPIHYTVGWGGRQGPRVGLAYEVLAWERFQAYVRLDYRLRRGPGGGLETYYTSKDRKETFETINYIAQDVSIFNRHERTRYRFQGAYNNLLWDDKFSISLTYDKLSDEDMASDYADQSLEVEPSQRTELEIHRQEDWWIANFVTRVRLNSFETVKQELPSLCTTWRPLSIADTGIISDNQLKLSYLDFVYANNIPHIHSFSSSRFAFTHRFYRPFFAGPVNITPEAGATEIFYGNSPHHDEQLLIVGNFGCDFTLPMYKFYAQDKHVLTPYARYQYITFPTSSPNKHYIFDIEDGWYRLNMVRFGSTQSLYTKDAEGTLRRYFYADLYANGFIDIPNIPGTVPKVYLRTIWSPTLHLRYTLDTAWDFYRGELDHFNWQTLWTVNANFAISFEYRHRDAWDWRKVDYDNFILDAYRSVEELRHSTLSDRRDTALLHFFYRYHPNWAVEIETLTGWNRENQSRYTEFEIDLIGLLRSSAQVKIAYQHRVSDDRVAIYFSLGARKPDRCRIGDYIPEF